MSEHLWRIGPRAEAFGDEEVDCHRRLRGPYTGVGTLLRRLVPDAHGRWPDLVARHALEILSAAPELSGLIGAGPQTLTSLAIPSERTRIYPANRTRRLAHGIFEFLRSYAELAGHDPLTLAFTNLDEADHTDQEFAAIALRRARSGPLRFVITTRTRNVVDELSASLHQYARQTTAPPRPDDACTDEEALRAFIGADCVSDDPRQLTAYATADPAVVARLHDERAAELTGGDSSLGLGALLHHLEHGSDPAQAGSTAMLDAANHCFDMGFYHALLDIVPRGRAITDPFEEQERHWLLTTKMTTALASLDRSLESLPYYDELRERYTIPMVHLFCSYAMAMLYTRHHPPEHKDHHQAKVLLNNAVAIASLLPDLEQRTFQTVFQNNGKALVEMHLGNLPGSLDLVNEGVRRLDAELDPDKHQLHRSVLLNNRAKVLVALGRVEEALADLDAVIEVDPNYPDYYFDRADVWRKLGEPARALADYATATTLTAPFLELHYNRADLLAELGDLEGAVTDLSYVVELEPDQLDARINLISLLIEAGALDTARAHVDEGLRVHPQDARLLHASGLLAVENDDLDLAAREFDHALRVDAGLVAARASRAALAHSRGDQDAAVEDLTAAIELDSANPDLFYNRGFVLQAAGRYREAIDDYTRALVLPGADEPELLQRRGMCEAELVDHR
ncbi:tetratricopeptide repeat protein [Lentzea sp. NPDC060358]|uniref:tetratricopeptide repeat protein n=1 Tax=Lentzea sp. NPDC060358 TaxID=3347103 RepID=UPI00365C6CA2